MKKLIIILFLLPFFAIGQGSFKIDGRNISSLDTFSITTIDTAWVFYISDNYAGSVQVDYSGLTGTLDGTLKMQQSSNGGVSFANMNISTHTMSSASGTIIFEFEWVASDALKLVFTRNSLTAGDVVPNVRLIRKK